jgi:multicomponent Na+:H+ antiporter subunit C
MLATFITSALLGVIGIYAVVMKRNFIKKIIGLAILTNCIHLLFISSGFRERGIAPIATPENLIFFSEYAVDPIPQALVLTSIVIQLSLTSLSLAIAILVFRHFKTLNTDEIKKLEG